MKHAPNDYALVIGVNDYPRWNKGAKSLKGSVKDAQNFRDWLVKDEGGGLPCSNVKLVLSSADPLSPRQHVIDDAFRELRELSEGKTRRRFYFYFSGHGHSRAGSFGQQSLCLANWSPADAGAALHLESYVKSSVGCLKFSEAVFFLDCCRLRQIAPLGQSSELECGDPQMADRYSAIVFGTEQYTPTYEGEVAEEIRGYFTAGLLQVLAEGTIELRDLVDRLKDVVPKLAKPKDQVVRAIPADTKIYLGPPGRKKLPRKRDAVELHAGEGVKTTIKIDTNLIETNDPNDPPIIRPGAISVFRDEVLVARNSGFLSTFLAPGTYEVRIDHGEASATYALVIDNKPFEARYPLPRRQSASLLSSTVDKHEWRTDPVVETSTWAASDGEQAAFVSLRPMGMPNAITGRLTLNGKAITEPNTLLKGQTPGTITLVYTSQDGPRWMLPIPIAAGWDTHIFIIVNQGRPQLGTASVSMRPAGLGFHPGDVLVDAYERSIADLVTGGPGPDKVTLDALLWGKFRNPLFGLLGAHFLIRKVRRDAVPDQTDLNRLMIVTENLGRLLGNDAPDVVALRVCNDILLKKQKLEKLPADPPLFNIGFQALVEATGWLPRDEGTQFDRVALGLDANSPWTVWNDELSEDTAEDPHDLRVPESIRVFMREAQDQAERTKEPLDFKRLIRRTMLPKNVLMTAVESLGTKVLPSPHPKL
jgi:hypothetical protein